MKTIKPVLILPFLAAALLLAPRARAQSDVYQYPRTDAYNGMRGQNFDNGWKFNLGDVSGAQSSGFDDSAWRSLNLPHDWSIELPFNQLSPAGEAGGYLDGGVGWYRKTFTVPSNYSGRRIFIGFDGVYMNSRVWINGTPVGTRPYGYSTFEYELTPYINFGGSNVVAVQVNNNQQPNSRFYSGSGIYRHVWLTVLNPVNIPNSGVFVSTPTVSAGSATVSVSTQVQNQSGTAQPAAVMTTILDATGKTVAGNTSAVSSVAANAQTPFSQSLTVANPNLWSPSSPYLYQVKTQVMVNGAVADTFVTTLGIRYFSFDANTGFSLNGQSMKLNGVCLHHDWGALGTAINYRAMERRIQIMKAMGVNAMRVSCPYPAAPELLDICDRLGIMVFAESFDCWQVGKTPYDYSLYFNQWGLTDLQDEVRQRRNHPCVIMWGIVNEAYFSPTVAIATNLRNGVLAVDPTRPVTWAAIHYNQALYQTVTNVLDLAGYNYESTYYTSDHTTYPTRKIFGSETVSALRSRGVYASGNFQMSSSGDVTTDNKSMTDTNGRAYVAGQFVWSGFDYFGETTPYTYPAKGSYYGIVDTCGFRKDIFYYYQSQWTSAPMVHICPMNWNTSGSVTVYVYSNCPSVTLFLNGTSQGNKNFSTPGGVGTLYNTWTVTWATGTLSAQGFSAASGGGTVVATDQVQTAGSAATVRLTAERGTVTGDGLDLVYVTADIIDASGLIVPTAANTVNFSVSGPGTIVGVDNGNSADVSLLKGSSTRQAFSGKCQVIVQSTGGGGPITVTATSSGLTTGSTTVTVTPSAPVITGISPDTGGSSSDGITNTGHLLINGTADANTVSVAVTRADLGSIIGTATPDVNGNWSLDYTGTNLPDGSYNFTATATNANGTSGMSNIYIATVDTAAPGAPAITGVSGSPLVVSGTAEISSMVAVTQAGTGVIGTAIADASGNWSFTYTGSATLTAGSYTFTATATDGAGNTSAASAGSSVTVGTSAPVITGISPDTGSSSTDGLTSANQVVLNGLAIPNSTVTVTRADLGAVGSATASGSGNWSFDYTGTTLADGTYTFTATATAGGQTSPASGGLVVTVDTAAPTAPAITSSSGTPLTLSGTAAANSSVTITQAGSGVIATVTANGSGNWSYSSSVILLPGSYTFTAAAADASGNTSAASTSFVLAPPSAPAISGISNDTGVSSTDGITNSTAAFTLNGTAAPGSTVTVNEFIQASKPTTQNPAITGTATAAAGLGSWSVSLSGLAVTNNPFVFTATAANAAGTSPASAFNVTLDTTVPTVSSSNRQNPSGTTVNAGSNVIYQVTFSEGVSTPATSAFTLTVTGTGSGTIASVTPVSTSVYNVIVNNVQGTSGSTLRLDVKTSGTGITDIAGNALSGGYTAGQTYTLAATSTGSSAWINAVSGGLWSAAANWSGGTVASGSGNTANFNTLDLTADNTVHLDASLTITGLVFGDTDTTTPASWIVDNNGSAANTLTLGGAAPTITVNALGAGNTTTISAGIAGSTAWSKAGAGTLVLSGNNTGTGAIAVNAGTLEVDGTLPVGGGTVTVSGNGTLAGTGTVNPAIALNSGGAVAPGTNGTVGTLSGTALTWNAGGQMLFDLGTTSDQLALSGALTKAAGTGGYGFVFTGGTSLATGTTVTLATFGSTNFTAQDFNASGSQSGRFAVNATSLQLVVGAAPNAPVITGISPDTGVSSTDGITNDNQLVLNGTADAMATAVAVTRADLGVIGTATPTNGQWSFDYTGTILPDGTYTFTATAANGNGASGASAAFTATVDTAVPVAPAITDLSGYPLVISGTSEAGSNVVVSQVGTGVIGTTTANGSGIWSFTYAGSINLGTGSYTFTATQTDVAGNTSPASAGSATTVTDTTPPAAPVFTSITTDTGISSTDQITNDPTLLLNGTAEAGSTVTVTQAGAGLIGTTATNGSGNWIFDYTGTTLADGTYTFTATATDAALNTGAASAAFVVTIDTSSPTVISSNRQSPTTTIVAPGSNVTYQVIFSEAVSGVTTAAFTLTGSGGGADSGTIATVTAVNTTTYNVTVNNVQGAFYDTLRLDVNGTGVTDVAGNAAVGFTGGQTYTLLLTGNGTWINTASGGLWGGPANWSGNVVASGTGNTANFSTLDLTADNTVHLDSAQTINRLVFADTATATGANWILDNNGSAANTLTLAGTTPTITVNALGTGNTTAISAVVAGTAGLAKLGVGTLVLSGANTISGAVTIGNTTATGTAVSGGIIRLDTGASLTASTLTIGPIGTLGGANAGVIVNGGTLVVTGATGFNGGAGVIAAVPARNIIEVDSGTATFTGAFATSLETSTLKITGGTVTFSSTLNFYKSSSNGTSDPTAHSIDFTGTAGGIIITGGNTTAVGAVGIGRNGAGAAMIVSGGTTTLNSTLLLANGISTVNKGGGLRVTGGTLTVSNTATGLVLISKGTSILNNFAVAEFAGGISTVGKISIAGDTSQTTGIGQVYVDGGTLYIGAGGIATPAGTSAAPGTYLYSVKLGGSGFLPGLTVAGASNVTGVGGTQFTGDGILGAAANWSSAVNMVLGGNTTLQAADAGGTAHHITLSGVLSGAGGLVKTGGGTLTLSGNNTYTGTLVVNAGTLEKSGAGASAIILNNGGAVAPGTNGTVGTLGASSLTWNGGGQALFDLGTSSDQIALTGALTKGNAGTYGFVFTGGTSLANGTTITLATFGSTNFTAQDLSATGGPAGSFAVNAANLQFVVSAIGTIAGTVTDSVSTAAISGASVSVVVSGTTYSTTSGSDGTYAIGSVPAGTGYTVTASATNYLNGTATNIAVTAGGTTSGVNFALNTSLGTITGTVMDNVSAAISGASVSVVVSGTTYSATSGFDGTYAIGSVPAGTGYTVTASATGYLNGTATNVAVTAGGTTPGINFALSPAITTGTITGTVTNSASAAISGASVSVVVGGTTYSATSTVNGTYEIDSVPAGTGYTVTASKTGYANGTATGVPVTAGQTTANVNITLTVSFASWAATHFTLAELADPSISGPAADPDYDGIPNLLEYAFNLNPKAADRGGLPVLGTTTVSGSQYLTLSYTQQTPTGDLTYAIQSSPDMAVWSAVTPVPVSAVDNGNGTQTVVVRDPVALDSSTHRFLRVQVSAP